MCFLLGLFSLEKTITKDHNLFTCALQTVEVIKNVATETKDRNAEESAADRNFGDSRGTSSTSQHKSNTTTHPLIKKHDGEPKRQSLCWPSIFSFV
jgi:hypothetical protein